MSGDAKQLDDAHFTKWWNETGDYELRQILLWRWDPIGISSEFPYAADEYDFYTPEIVFALRSGTSVNEIASLLSRIERERMGLGEGSLGAVVGERLQAVGQSIQDWFENSRHRWAELGPLHR